MTSGVWWSALLAGAAVAVLLAPGSAALRVRSLLLGAGAPVRPDSPPPGAGSAGAVSSTGPRPSGWRTPTSRYRRIGSTAALPFVAGTAALLAAGPLASAVTAPGTVLALRWRRGQRAAAERARERSRAVEACAALSAELRAGRSPAQALDVASGLAVGPSRAALSAAAAAAALGGDVAAALRPEQASTTAVPEVLRALSACWTVCAGSGGGLAAAVERLEEGLRADQEQRRAVAAELAGPRATAGMLAVLPLAGLVLAAGLGADPLRVLLHTPVGGVCLLVGLALDGLGLLWTGRLVARAGGTG